MASPGLLLPAAPGPCSTRSHLTSLRGSQPLNLLCVQVIAKAKASTACVLQLAPGTLFAKRLLSRTTAQVIAKAKVPIVKFEDAETGYAFDVSFDVANGPEARGTEGMLHAGASARPCAFECTAACSSEPTLARPPPRTTHTQAAENVRALMDSLPPMRPLVMVLKVFLQQRELNEVGDG